MQDIVAELAFRGHPRLLCSAVTLYDILQDGSSISRFVTVIKLNAVTICRLAIAVGMS